MLPLDGDYGPLLDVKLVFDTSVAYQLYDAFEDEVMPQENDKIIVAMQLPQFEGLFSFLLPFGEKVTILKPTNLRGIIKERLLRALMHMDDFVIIICKTLLRRGRGVRSGQL